MITPLMLQRLKPSTDGNLWYSHYPGDGVAPMIFGCGKVRLKSTKAGVKMPGVTLLQVPQAGIPMLEETENTKDTGTHCMGNSRQPHKTALASTAKSEERFLVVSDKSDWGSSKRR
jgi:hypothetical protein